MEHNVWNIIRAALLAAVLIALLALLAGCFLPLFIRMAKDMWEIALM